MPTNRKKTPPQFRPAGSSGGISAISVSGFKSIREKQTIQVRPLTILAGANNAGKSSMIQPLLLMKQTLEATFDPGPLLLKGPNIKFSSVDQLFSRTKPSATVNELRVEISDDFPSTLTTFFGRDKGSTGIRITQMNYVDDLSGKTCSLRPEMTGGEIRRQVGQVSDYPGPPEGTLSVSGRRCFLLVSFWSPSNKAPGLSDPQPEYRWAFHHRFQGALLRLIHLPGLRGMPERAYPKTTLGPLFQGPFNPYAATVVKSWQEENSGKLLALGRALEALGLTWKVEARDVDDVSLSLHIPRLKKAPKGLSRDTVNLADAGVGISQVLPVVVALLEAEAGQIVYLEEPDTHLHPRAQLAMAEILADAAKRGVRVVAETHSALLLLGIQTLVAEGKLSPDLVKLHWFTRNRAGYTQVSSADLDESGAFGDWPEDFGGVDLNAQKRYLDAAEKRLLDHVHAR